MIDEYIPEPKREMDKPFMMAVEDVFSIVWTVVTGRVDRGVAKKGDPISIVGLRETKDSVITGTEMFRRKSWTRRGGRQRGHPPARYRA
ncbi:MAG: hypothetical protein U0X87_08140 [Anaerolineales bacterium]